MWKGAKKAELQTHSLDVVGCRSRRVLSEWCCYGIPHGAACLVAFGSPETSCEMRNMFLDRALLVETMHDAGCNFFSLSADAVSW